MRRVGLRVKRPQIGRNLGGLTRDRIASAQPVAEVNIGATPRAERAPSLGSGIAADRATASGALFLAAVWHIRVVSQSDPDQFFSMSNGISAIMRYTVCFIGAKPR